MRRKTCRLLRVLVLLVLLGAFLFQVMRYLRRLTTDMALSTVSNEYLDNQAYMDCAQTTAAEADAEIRKLLNESYDKAKTLLRDNRALLDEISLYLLQKETITGDELMAYVNADSAEKEKKALEEAAEGEKPAAEGEKDSAEGE